MGVQSLESKSGTVGFRRTYVPVAGLCEEVFVQDVNGLVSGVVGGSHNTD